MFDVIKSNPILWVIIFLAVVAPSFLVGAVKVVFFIIIGIILLFVILGLIFRVKIQTMQSRMEEQMRGAANQNRTSQTQGNEGDVKIFTTSKTKTKRVRDDVGEYVDFEEVKNK